MDKHTLRVRVHNAKLKLTQKLMGHPNHWAPFSDVFEDENLSSFKSSFKNLYCKSSFKLNSAFGYVRNSVETKKENAILR